MYCKHYWMYLGRSRFHDVYFPVLYYIQPTNQQTLPTTRADIDQTTQRQDFFSSARRDAFALLPIRTPATFELSSTQFLFKLASS